MDRLQGDAREHFVIATDIEGILPRPRERQILEIYDEIAGEKILLVGNGSHGNPKLDGSLG